MVLLLAFVFWALALALVASACLPSCVSIVAWLLHSVDQPTHTSQKQANRNNWNATLPPRPHWVSGRPSINMSMDSAEAFVSVAARLCCSTRSHPAAAHRPFVPFFPSILLCLCLGM